MTLDWLLDEAAPLDAAAHLHALQHQQQLTKPPGSLGELETIASQFCAWQRTNHPSLETICVRVFAADHGVAQRGVSAYPQSVTAQMIANFVAGGAAVSVLSKHAKADLQIVDLGTVGAIDGATRSHADYVDARIHASTADFSEAPAMDPLQLTLALNAGRDQVSDAQLFIGGDMGIGNTTAAAAIFCALLDLPAETVCGPGTGLNDEGVAHKAEIVRQALHQHAMYLSEPLSVLQHLGGFEIAALCGAYLTAAQRGIPILVDGFICTAAALLACRIQPAARAWMLFAHQSAEPAHRQALTLMNARPLLSLDMRLGEGSAALIALPLLRSALHLHNEMASFDSAKVDKGAPNE